MDHETDASALTGSEPTEDPDANACDTVKAPLARSATITDIDLLSLRWSTRIVRAGAGIMLFVQILYLTVDWRLAAGFRTAVLPLHLMNVLDAGLFWVVLGTTIGKIRWRPITLLAVLGMFVFTAALAIATGNCEPLVLMMVTALVGAAALMPWDGRWQTALTLAGVGTMAMWARWAPAPDPYYAIHWLAIGAAAGLGYFAALTGARYRKELTHRIEQLDANHRRLLGEVAEREAAVAASEIANQRLRESETKLRKIFETSADAITINRLSDGRYLDLNEGFYRVGYSREETLAQSAGSLGIWADREQLRRFLRQIRNDGAVANFEFDVRTKRGAVMPYLISATVVELGGEACVVSICRDITTIKRTQRELVAAREVLRAQVEALRQSQQRLRAEISERELAQKRLSENAGVLRRIFDTTSVGVAINLVADGRFIQVNRACAEIFGYSCEELLQLTLRDTGAIINRGQFRDFLDELEQHGSIPDREVDLRSRDGTIHPLQVSGVKIEIGGEPCVATIVVDISRRIRIEQELIAAREAALAASQAKSEFLSSMSHEIRTPMNAILGMADLLWESELSSEQRRYLDTMRNNGNALLELINEILDLAKVESGRLHLEQTPFDLREMVEKLLETLALRAHAKGLELTGRIAPGTPTALLGDTLRIRQILFNLIGNAIKFTQAGEIELALEAATQPQAANPAPAAVADGGAVHAAIGRGGTPVWIRFTVRDTGIGIAPEHLATIFSSFTQADSSIARKYGGTGLGLAIVKRLVDLMGGEIAIESAPGAGSKFIVTVPLEAQSAEDAAIDPEMGAYDERALAGVRALVTDDAASSRATLREMLEAAGAAVEEATDGEEAIAKSDSAIRNAIPYNVFLVDGRMPGMDGIETARRLADADCGNARGAIILMLTADALRTGPGLARELDHDTPNGCRYLIKPVKRADLLGAVMEVTGRRPQGSVATAYSGDANTLSAAAVANSGAAQMAMRPLRILLADDSPDNRMLIEAYLKKAPYTIDHAEDGSVAVEKVKVNHYDLVLMDIQMPVMDGYTAVRTIREWERARGAARVPIIALTASALDEAVQRSLEAGCDAHVSKPVRKATLFEAIRNVTAALAGAAACNGNSAIAANGDDGMKRNVVQVDADLRDLVPGFLAHKRADTGIIQAAIERADFQTLSQIGHKMKGEGGSYGFDAVTEMGAALERAAQARDLATARRTLEEFAAYLESVDVVYG